MKCALRPLALLSLVALVALAPLPLAPGAPTVKAARPGEDLSKELESLRDRAGAPGVVALALVEGQVAAWGAAGVRAYGSDARLAIDDPIHLGSCAKAITATLVATLVEDELLTWDTTVAEALPAFSKRIDPGYHSVTVEQLLRHRGGIAERRRPELGAAFDFLLSAEGPAPEVRLDTLARVLELPPVAPPEDGFDYSNYGYMAVGAMVQARAGKPWSELIVERVFRPLELKSAGAWSPSGADVPVGHTQDGDGWTPLAPGPKGALPDALGPAGLVHSNLADWARFVADHLAGFRGEDGLVTAESYRRLHADPLASGYACGWGVDAYEWDGRDRTLLTHAGSDNTWYATVFALPEADVVVVTAANCGGTPGAEAAEGAKERLLEALRSSD